ncbi:phage terminase large subunit [Erythrobacter sp. EC-HK427]|uniref:phage terminase large subunit n=1 Tax=Erythrobacter sp. EC-HK427 TaxID=2038396 RepID=UPI00125BF3C3|nr:phage terminase large subunit [Erythrobacter sp. EC-HK427]VVS95959.1 conserved hypothetical protein [Erythrobacter sp. EC-HK427]
MTEVHTDDVIAALARREFDFFLRLAFAELGGEGSYSHNWHIDAIIHQLDRLIAGENRKLIVTMPPRHLKSRILSVAWVAWMLGHNPALSFLCISYGQDLADDMATDCLKIMDARWYRRAFPAFSLSSRAVSHLRTRAGGRRMATSVEGKTTGFGADIIVVDDPMKAQDLTSPKARASAARWYDDTLSQRLNDQLSGRIIVTMQRLHEGDLVGVLRQRPEWFELRLPAIAEKDELIPLTRGRQYQRREGCALHPARQPLSLLLERKAANPFVFASQLQQNPVPEVGNLIEAGWLKTWDEATVPHGQGQVVMSLDTASKDNPFNDYSAFITARIVGKSVYIMDVCRKRLQFPGLKAKTIELARTHGVQALLIEDAASGQQLVQVLRAEEPCGVPSPIARRPAGDKISRVMGSSAMIEAGRLFLPDEAHWLPEFKTELLGFPAARHDDQVDALSQLLLWVQEKDLYRAPAIAGPEEMTDEGVAPALGFDQRWQGMQSQADPWGAL